MFSIYYHRFKKWFWLVLFFLFELGAVTKYFHRPLWEVVLNAVIGLVCLGMFLIFARKGKDE
ncbi:hypothetical protein [Falsibacillus pallidus]|uniref:hypothetical protein n=1 Tax=Falsibacillus pallidus TaxID=493781 RepID=UPI003D978493